MIAQISELLGGLGIFLLGVVIMTGGLKGVAGHALHQWLTRFTRSPLSGAVTGATTTAILQSSSATTVAAVGFVGAGLLTFPQALGIVFGANLGTTVTGWLVALVGFKLKLGSAVFPLIFVGVAMRLFGRQRWQDAGMALAGFALIFVGIEAMQGGMAGLEQRFDFARLASPGLFGRLQLVLVGIVVTILTQSSSAGVAAALTALYAGAISFEQAACLVIGMDVGTTATAALATLGGSVESRRTGYSHVVYNLLTGCFAFMFLTPFVMFLEQFWPGLLQAEAELCLVAFHSSFNLLGVAFILPFSRPFAALLIRMVKQQEMSVLQRLDENLLGDPVIALEAARASMSELCAELCAYGEGLMRDPQGHSARRDNEFREALSRLRSFIDRIHVRDVRSREWALLTACLHALDHLRRLQHRLGQVDADLDVSALAPVGAYSSAVLAAMAAARDAAQQGQWLDKLAEFEALSAEGYRQADLAREAIIAEVALGEDDTLRGNQRLELVRWLRRVARHLWRIAHHMQGAADLSLPASSVTRGRG